MKVHNLVNSEGRAIANQFVIDGNNERVFQSYDSVVCKVTPDTITFGRDWDYSNTTRRNLYMFLKYYAGLREVKGKGIEKAIQTGSFEHIGVTRYHVAYDETLY